MLPRYVLIESDSCGILRKEGLEFDIRKPYTFCRICGLVYQTPADRSPFISIHHNARHTERRRIWSHQHARTHAVHEHRMLELSGRFVTPEAAEKLVTYGICPVSDMAFTDEHEHAAKQANRRPVDDVEGATKCLITK